MSKEIFDRLTKIIQKDISVDPSRIKEDSRIVDDLGADSLDITEMLMSIREEFGREISDDEVKKIVTVKDIINLLNGSEVDTAT